MRRREAECEERGTRDEAPVLLSSFDRVRTTRRNEIKWHASTDLPSYSNVDSEEQKEALNLKVETESPIQQ
jgi:hypothetical protein